MQHGQYCSHLTQTEHPHSAPYWLLHPPWIFFSLFIIFVGPDPERCLRKTKKRTKENKRKTEKKPKRQQVPREEGWLVKKKTHENRKSGTVGCVWLPAFQLNMHKKKTPNTESLFSKEREIKRFLLLLDIGFSGKLIIREQKREKPIAAPIQSRLSLVQLPPFSKWVYMATQLSTRCFFTSEGTCNFFFFPLLIELYATFYTDVVFAAQQDRFFSLSFYSSPSPPTIILFPSLSFFFPPFFSSFPYMCVCTCGAESSPLPRSIKRAEWRYR